MRGEFVPEVGSTIFKGPVPESGLTTSIKSILCLFIGSSSTKVQGYDYIPQPRLRLDPPVSHAIMSLMQYYPEDGFAYAIVSARTLLHNAVVSARKHLHMQLCPPRAKPSL